MKKIISVFLFFFFTFQFLSANSINGKIIDAGTQSPLDFVNVALFRQGSKVPAAGVITDKNGAFKISPVPIGKYDIRVSFVGYTPYNHQLNFTGDPLNLGIIKLTEDGKKLAEVEVLGQASQMHFDVDKKVFSVDQNIAAAGGSATDVLKNIPSVKVDNEGNVSLRKDANVEVWINGKPSGLTVDNRAQILQQMPAESIESIEVMTNPSAKYNPEGTAGIINLVLKKNRKAGHYGSISTGLMYPTGGKPGGTLGANINYSSSKVDAYANIGYRDMSFKGGGKNDRYNNIDPSVATTLLHQETSNEHSFSGLFMRAGVDYHLDTKNTIGFSGFGMVGSGNSNEDISYLKTGLTTNPFTVLDNYSRNNTETGTHPSFHASLDYQHEFDKKGTTLTSSLSFSHHKRGFDDRYIKNDPSTGNNSDISQSSDNINKELIFKVDYTDKLTETSRFEAGWQSDVNERLDDASGLDNQNAASLPDYLNKFDYNEQIHAAYLTYGDRFFNKLNVQLGLRAEYMWKKSTNTTYYAIQSIAPKTEIQPFPSMYLSYPLSKSDELQLNFTRRVNRPRGRQINPFRDYSDSTNITYGNPDLSSQYTSALEFNYIKTWDNHSLSASAYYRFTDNVIETVRIMNAGTMENTYMNVAKTKNTGLELVAKDRLFTILNLTSSLNLYYGKMDSSVYMNPYDKSNLTTIPGQSTFSWTANVIANLMFSKTLSGQISGEYSSPSLIAQGKENAQYQVDLGLRKSFLDRKLSVNLIAMDIFDMNRDRTTTWGNGFYQKNESYFHGRMIGITVSYNFGNMKPKQTESKKKEVSTDINMENNME
jgi:hypothetical protein